MLTAKARKFTESEWVRNGGRFADFIGTSGGSSGGAGSPESFVMTAGRKDIADIYSIPGVNVTVTDIQRRPKDSSQPTSLRALMTLTDDKGKPLGEMNRSFGRDGTVHHEVFRVATAQQGEGLAARINQHAEGEYRRRGFKQIELEADIDVGKYAWARQAMIWPTPLLRNLRAIRHGA